MSAGVGAALAWRARSHPNYLAFVVHRVSGLLLGLFLPLHFWALGQAINGEAALGDFLRWTESPLLKFAETGLVILLAAHFAGGIRLLAIEFAGWRNWQRGAVAVTAGFSLAAGLLFLLNVVSP
ncbi:MAG TPA: succinate dehydrogenase [Alphaproteobacteria bacterium]|nr:succinate dehydrogenase [Alphaproteobacteria bacterium]